MAQAKTKQALVPQSSDVTIQRVTTVPTLGADGALHNMYHVQYMVGEHGPFFLDTPAEGFSAAETRQRVEAAAEELRAFIG